VVVISAFSLQVACDLTIAVSMVYYLRTRCTRVKQCVNLQGSISMIVQIIVTLCRTIAATTTLALYSITSGAFSLFVL
jgi:hypothetical protein